MSLVHHELRGRVAVLTGDPISAEEALRIESQISGPVFQTEDAKEGPKAFMEKRKPAYKGR